MTGWRKVYCEATGVYLGCLWDDVSGVQCENREARLRWFPSEERAMTWLRGQVVRDRVAA